MAGLLMNGKTEEEVKAFMQEADEAHTHLSISFDAPDDKVRILNRKKRIRLWTFSFKQ